MKRFPWNVVLAAFVATGLITLLPLPSEAQTDGNLLRGLTKMNFVIEKLSDNSTTCGVTENLVRNAVRYPASSAKFQLVDPADPSVDAVLYIKVSTLFFRTGDLRASVVALKPRHSRTSLYIFRVARLQQ